MNYGEGMAGMADGLNVIVEMARSRFQPFTYLEIGVANGQTLAAVSLEASKRGQGWRSVGVDLPDGYSLNKANVEQNARGQHLQVVIVTPDGTHDLDPVWNQVTLYLDDSQELIPRCWRAPVHLALIDACHCKACATTDFLNVEPYIQPGGIVMMHDFGEDDIGIYQPRNHPEIDVRGACRDLGLLDNKRAGWEWIGTVTGDKTQGASDMGIFQASDMGIFQKL